VKKNKKTFVGDGVGISVFFGEIRQISPKIQGWPGVSLDFKGEIWNFSSKSIMMS
jgi:hypothetical protein